MARRRRDAFLQRKGPFSRGGIGRRVLVWILLLSGAFLLLSLLGYYQLLAYLQGDHFRDNFSENLRNRTQAEQFRLEGNLAISGNRLSLPAASMNRKGFWSQAAARRISTEFDRASLLDRHLNLAKLTMEEANLVLDADRMGEPLPPVLPEQEGFWQKFTPRTVTLKAFECRDTDASLRLKGEVYSLAGCSISAAPKGKLGKDVWQLHLENGRLHTPLSYLRDCGVRSASLLLDPNSLNLTECRLMLTPGELRIKGGYEFSSSRWRVTLRANKANVERLLGGDWKKRLTGELFGDLELIGAGNRLHRGAGILALQQGELEGLPFLSELPLNGGRPYRSLKLEKAECRLSYPYAEPEHNIRDAWLVDHIDIRSEGGSLLVRGHVILAPDGALRGVLNLGFPESAISSHPLYRSGLMRELFSRGEEKGYVWLNINISGTVDEPREDLSVRLSTILSSSLSSMPASAVQALHQWMPGLLPPDDPTGEGSPTSTPKGTPEAPLPEEENLPAAPGGILNDAVDTAGGVINSGLRVLF